MKRLLFMATLAIAGVAVADEGAREGSAVSTAVTTARTGKLSPGWKLIYCTVATHYRTGKSDVESATSDLTIPAATAWQVYIAPGELYIAFILDASTGSCSIYRQTPGPTGVPPMHASIGHRVTDVGYAVTGGSRDVAVTVTAGTTCLCTSWVAGGDPVEGCALSGATLTITTGAPDTNVGYICTT